MAEQILKLYLDENIIDKYQSQVALKVAKSSHHKIEEILLACGFVTQKEIAKIKAKRLNLEFIDLKKFMPHKEALKLIPRVKAVKYSLLPLMISGGELFVAIDEYSDIQQFDYLKNIANMNIRFVIAAKDEILTHLMTHPYYTEDDETLC
jgi:hypothetical protein